MESSRERRLANVITLLFCGILAGVVLAAVAFPIVGASGLTAKSASDSFRDLPASIKIPPLPAASTLLASDGKTVLATFFEEDRRNAALRDVAPVMRQAIVAAEDTRFYTHQGVDAKGILRALVRNQTSGEVTQGASTLTQQYVRSVLKYSATNPSQFRAATEETAARKLREIRYAMALEKEYSKNQILENYLNITYFGNGGYGIYTASQVYFSKKPSQLTLAEAAMIAGLAQDPTRYNPVNNKRYGTKPALDRRTYVLRQMVKMKYISPEEAEAAEKAPIGLRPKDNVQGCEHGRASYGFFCGWFLDWWKANPTFGNTTTERLAALRRGGYRIVSSIDVRMQSTAQKQVDRRLSAYSRFATGIVMVQPGSGRVLAMAINRKYGIKKNPGGKTYPYTENPLLSGSTVSPGYQAGSTFKMFTMLAALQQGIPLSHTLYAPRQFVSQYVGGCRTGRYYCPRNASGSMTGVHTMSSGFGESANTYFIQLQQETSVKAAVAAAQSAGVVFRGSTDQKNIKWAQDSNQAWGSFTLGTAQVTPLDMANAYATVAARGKFCRPTPIRSVTDQQGREMSIVPTSCKQAFSPQVADAANDAARCPVGDGTQSGMSCTHPGGGATATSVGGSIDRPIAGKTGTTDNNNAGWFVGYTPNLAAASFIANPDKYYDTVPNSQLPIQIVRETFEIALQGLPVKQFVRAPRRLSWGTMHLVPDVKGATQDEAIYRLRAAGFTVSINYKPEDSDQPAGRVSRTEPPAGSYVSKGSSIRINVSNGKKTTRDPRIDQLCRLDPKLPICAIKPGEPGFPEAPGQP
ncbi:penicillin-binding protein [Cryptosporangium aurantiacum]|uniref:Membrane carboxypeptidase (Penicillin-binding protein) n=1 Tax=Cryptosporangium aurantiacum TaxID=134849 RepID=A0A1M7PTI1_9ACTN|nr:penicillin-binding protein [Cryptosporangium aurantiacum]SHN20781.1 Membrane carboxypeptidase (penicillin-binding protein) [Cryptosporangium aurantiacum]